MASRKVNDPGYFSKHRKKLSVNFAEEESDVSSVLLREAQAGAYWAVRSHFTVSNNPAIVVMPTGSGKTAVMTLIAFGIVNKRLLIIAPTRIILQQIAQEFRTLRIITETNCIPGKTAKPRIHIIEHELNDEASWKKIADFDVVISTPQCIAPQYKRVCCPPEDIELFDTIFFDEAHHLKAPTWESILQTFPRAKIIGFSATPYRADKKALPGDIAYSYPLGKAIKKGIYRPIEFIPVSVRGDKSHRDKMLIEKAKAVYEQENTTIKDPGEKVKLLIRTDRKNIAEFLQKEYAKYDLDLEVVYSNRSIEENLSALDRVQKDPLCAGIISVGMLGEGLDLPQLRIAVMHSPHQSFPATIQFIGRICRLLGKQGGTAKLIAIPDEVQDHTEGLYDLGADWISLIPEVTDAAVDLEKQRREFSKNRRETIIRVNMVDTNTIFPFYSVTAYKITSDGFDLSNPILDRDFRIYQSPIDRNNNWRIFITRTNSRPPWTTSNTIQNITYDLHIYYQTESYLFEATTARDIALDIRQRLAGNAIEPLSKQETEQVISHNNVYAYFNIGMRRVASASTMIPSYKMMTGIHAEDTVRIGDGTFYSVGHIFGRVDGYENVDVIGVNGQEARIWASARSHFYDFTKWCDELATYLKRASAFSLPYVTHLKQPQQATELTAKPYAAEFHPKFYEHVAQNIKIEYLDIKGKFKKFDLARFDILVDDRWNPKNPTQYHLIIQGQTNELIIRYDLAKPELFNFYPTLHALHTAVRVPDGGRFIDRTLHKYFEEYPPTIYLDDGSVLVGDLIYCYQPPIFDIPEELFTSKNWPDLDCNITVEDWEMTERKKDGLSVIEATAMILPDIIEDDAVIFCDHRAGEIADYVGITRDHAKDPEGLLIHFVHCKASDKPTPGARQKDAYEVLGQARKCVRWLYNRDLFDEIDERMGAKNIVSGSKASFRKMIRHYTPQTSKYRVHVVQPGFDINKIQEWKDASIRLMFLSLYDELRNADVDLHIIGS